jgi:hypothetical protein
MATELASIAIILKPDTFNVELHIRLETGNVISMENYAIL